MVEDAPFVLPTYFLTRLNRGNVNRFSQRLTSQESTAQFCHRGYNARIALPYPTLRSSCPDATRMGSRLLRCNRNSIT
jgi:hypothetical protein